MARIVQGNYYLPQDAVSTHLLCRGVNDHSRLVGHGLSVRLTEIVQPGQDTLLFAIIGFTSAIPGVHAHRGCTQDRPQGQGEVRSWDTHCSTKLCTWLNRLHPWVPDPARHFSSMEHASMIAACSFSRTIATCAPPYLGQRCKVCILRSSTSTV